MIEFTKVLLSSMYIIKYERIKKYKKSIFPFSITKANKSFSKFSIFLKYNLFLPYMGLIGLNRAIKTTGGKIRWIEKTSLSF